MATIDDIKTKLTTFKTALDNCETAIKSKTGSTVTFTSADQVASKISAISTTKSMGSKTVTFKQNTVTYGVRVTESESDPTKRVTYLDDAVGITPVKTNTSSSDSTNYYQWKNSWIFEKIYPVMLNTNGTVAYKLNTEDQTKKATSGSSDVANINYAGNAMVCIEKFYTKFSMNGENEEIRISNTKQTGYEAIGFIREDGTEADKIFIPMFMGSYDSSSKLRSISGQDIKYSVSWTNFRTAAQKNGANYDIESYSMNEAISAVFAVLMKTCNPKTALGDGRNYNSGKTGVLVNKGAIAYDTSTKATKFMWIEDFTSNYSSGMCRFETGILSQSSKLYVKMKPPYSGTSTSGYDEVTDAVLIQNQYLSKMKCSNKYGRCPIEGKGSDSTYECSFWYTTSDSSGCVSRRGRNCGVWDRNFDRSASSSTSFVGAALSFLPPK